MEQKSLWLELEGAARQKEARLASALAEEKACEKLAVAGDKRALAQLKRMGASSAFAALVAETAPAFADLVAGSEWKRLASLTDQLWGRPPRLSGLRFVERAGEVVDASLDPHASGPSLRFERLEWELSGTLTLRSVVNAKTFGQRSKTIASFDSFAQLAGAGFGDRQASPVDRLTAALCARTIVERVRCGDLVEALLLQASREAEPLREAGR